jgi:aspartyl-tRNA(Asn)/glutamyl-tRNA(Gln) amidotransferase subunit A
MDVLAGYDGADRTSSRQPVPDHEAICERGLGDVRIGIPRNYFYEPVTAEVKALMEDSLAEFERSGARLVELDVPDPRHLTELSRIIVYAEASSLHGVWLRERRSEYSPQVAVRAATGIAIPAPAYLEALCLRPRVVRRFVEAVFARCDVLHTPTLAIPVPTRAETDVGSGRAMWDIIARMVHCTAPVNYLGLPAVAVPAGFTGNGLPASFQLIGRPFAEATLLRVAHAYQQTTDWHRRVPQRH